MPEYLDAAPLLRAIDEKYSLDAIAYGEAWDPITPTLTEAQAVMIRRIRATSRVRVEQADALCIDTLGLHPCFIFGEAWWNEGDEADADLLEEWAAGEDVQRFKSEVRNRERRQAEDARRYQRKKEAAA